MDTNKVDFSKIVIEGIEKITIYNKNGNPWREIDLNKYFDKSEQKDNRKKCCGQCGIEKIKEEKNNSKD